MLRLGTFTPIGVKKKLFQNEIQDARQGIEFDDTEQHFEAYQENRLRKGFTDKPYKVALSRFCLRGNVLFSLT